MVDVTTAAGRSVDEYRPRIAVVRPGSPETGSGSAPARRGPLWRRVAVAAAFTVTAAVVTPLALGKGVAGSGIGAGGGAGAHAVPGPRFAPSITADDLRHPGSHLDLQVPPGRPTVVSFFASWCDPCRRELPLLAAASRRLGERVAFLGVDVRDSRRGALAMLDGAGVQYPAVADPDAAITGRFGLRGMPSTVFVARDGRLIGLVMGRLTDGSLTRWLGRLGAP
jgi:cytochrome c biogenesis protein CcmG/thiol:disulfide interchange protein DsbE